MRILFCTLDYPPSAAGGAEQQARLQAEALARRGHRVTVVCARTPGHSSDRINGVEVQRLHRIEVKYIRTISYLAMLGGFLVLRARRHDLVHVHLANLQADVAVAVARLLRRPTYVKLAAGGPLGEVNRMKPVAWLTRYYGLRHADAVQAISSEIADDLASIGVPIDRIRRVPNAVVVPAEPAQERRDVARAELRLGTQDVIAIYAGRMERTKGVADLIAAWRQVHDRHARLLLVGRPGLKDPVGLKELPSGIEHHDWTDGMDRYLAAADIFVLPSYTEGMSNALLEAMAAGLACVSSSVGAATEMIRDGENGLLIDAGDRTALVTALRRLVDDRRLRESIGAQARADVSEKFEIEAIVDRIESTYESIMVAT